MNNTRLKLVSLLLAADMALTFCPVSAFAASSGKGDTTPLTSVFQQLDDENGAVLQTFEVSTPEKFRDAVNAINNADSGSYVIKLEKDITLNDSLVLSKNTTTILGENHTLSGTQDNVLGADGTAVLNLGAENYSETLTFDGGPFYITGSLLKISGNAILNMYNHVTLQNNYSYDNGGGGIRLFSSQNVSIRNCTITDNNATRLGGGIYMMSNSSADLSGTGNVICNNIASGSACDIYLNSANNKLKLFDAASMNRTYRDSGKKIDGWYLDDPLYVPSEDAEAVDVSSELTGGTGSLSLVASYRVSQEPEIPDGGDAGGGDAGGAGSVLGSVVAGTAIGVGGYLVGTDFWLNTLYGFVPTNRIQLAEALWNRADCPAPQSNALYSDIAEDDSDAQQAARWCVEQNLMKDCTRTEQDGTETVIFKPYGYVFRPQAIGAWYQQDSLLKERT